MSVEEDDKPTVVLDLVALKKQRLKQTEDLENMAGDLEFNVGEVQAVKEKSITPLPVKAKMNFKIILFDFQSDFFQKSLKLFPQGFNYQVAKDLNELNSHLKTKDFQILVLNYNVNPKAVNQLCAQLKRKLPTTKTLIMAKSISPEKAKLHAKSPSGANAYYQFPVDALKLEEEFLKIHSKEKKVG